MLTAAPEKTGEENCIAEKIIFATFPLEAQKGGTGLSGGQKMSGEKIGGEGPSGINAWTGSAN